MERENGSRSHSEADDEELATRARCDRAAFGVLYDRYVERVHAFFLRRLGDREAAEDATAQTFLRALKAMPAYRTDAPSFVAVDTYRVKGRFMNVRLHDGFESAEATPEESVLRRETAGELRAMLASLSADQRAVVELRLAGLDDREIAFALDRTPGAIRVAQHRALKRLRERFGASSGDSGRG